MGNANRLRARGERLNVYTVHKIFGPTLQGEGSLVGSRTCFVRFAGCNMWNGLEQDRASSSCPFCDTQFRGGTRMSVDDIADALERIGARRCESITLSGGEPLLQVDAVLLQGLADRFPKLTLVVETNGTQPIARPSHVPLFVVCSPKVTRAAVRLDRCDDLKVLFPHPNPRITPEAFADFPAARRFVQPINHRDEIDADALKRAAAFVIATPGWRLSMQAHKICEVE